LTWEYWLILFSTSCYANLLGLNISSALNSIITIYILIPFILVPQLLLGGALIKFDDLHQEFSNEKYVPVVGDLMVSRWAYEALSVAQFKHNDYQRHFFDVEQKMSEASFQSNYVLPRLETLVKDLAQKQDWSEDGYELELLSNELKKLHTRYGVKPFELLDSFEPVYFNQSLATRALDYILTVKEVFKNRYLVAAEKKDSIYYALVDKMGKDQFNQLRNDYFNESISDIVTNRNQLEKIELSNAELIQKKDPIFKLPYSDYFRAHFYSPIKMVGGYAIDTVWFNAMAIWIYTALLYYILINDYLKKFLNTFSGKKKKKN
jgi:hypothetical protein